MTKLLNLIFGRRLRRHTSEYLDKLTSAPIRASEEKMSTLLKSLASSEEAAVTLGATSSGQSVTIPLSEIMTSHAIITGGSGAGKTRFALTIIKALIDQLPQSPDLGFGILDPKNELYSGALFLLAERLAELDRENPDAAAALRRRVVMIDFSAQDPIAEYNLLALSPGTDPNFFTESRADLLIDLLPGRDNVSLSGNSLLRRALLLLSEFSLHMSQLPDLLFDDRLRATLVARSKNEDLKIYFAAHFQSVPKQTITALARRVEALFCSQSVKLALNGASAPQFRALQDEGKIILINCFGENLSRSVRQLLQALVISDVSQSVFARKRKEIPFLWFLDEAQNCFVSDRLRDQMTDLLRMSRSFGTFFLYLTQNIITAVHDQRMLSDLYTNVKWSFSLRGQPSDCTFLKPALPVTGRKLRPQIDPFEAPTYYTLNEERAMELDGIANLPDRMGFLWLRAHSPEAVKISTANLLLPPHDALERALKPLESDPQFGGRISREEYERRSAGSRATPRAESPKNFGAKLADAYQRMRGDEA